MPDEPVIPPPTEMMLTMDLAKLYSRSLKETVWNPNLGGAIIRRCHAAEQRVAELMMKNEWQDREWRDALIMWEEQRCQLIVAKAERDRALERVKELERQFGKWEAVPENLRICPNCGVIATNDEVCCEAEPGDQR